MQTGLDRADGHAEGRGDLGQRHAQEVVQDDDRAPGVIESAHSAVHEVAVGEGASDVWHRRHVDGLDLDLDGSTSSMARLVQARIDGQAMEPGIEPLGVTQRRQVAPGSDQGILDRVSSELMVPEDEAGRLVQPRDGGAGKFGEGVMIAPLRSFHDTALVHGRLDCDTAMVVVFTSVWRPASGFGSRPRSSD